MGIKRKIKDNRWYIVNLMKKNRGGKFMLIRKSFTSAKKAHKAISLNFPGNEILFEAVKGIDAKEYGFTFNKELSPGWGHVIKYHYPPESMTQQERKSYRTKARRWKRKFNKELTHAYAAS